MDFSESYLKELPNSKLINAVNGSMMYVDFRHAEYNIQAEPVDYLQCDQVRL